MNLIFRDKDNPEIFDIISTKDKDFCFRQDRLNIYNNSGSYYHTFSYKDKVVGVLTNKKIPILSTVMSDDELKNSYLVDEIKRKFGDCKYYYSEFEFYQDTDPTKYV